ncbi:EAL domain-containing protein [Blastococcus tunisiensis]|uniref:PAS domain S-box-containing protein/diguanylate cyclase (GGDEF) domain-containing protein n=1 Tax=Blastococcus tunisiensis TaxID=1798228 RepID=A0A1I2HPK6_9ACTN|nr:EAL domain-containing protein [Blastococcus sp. DSM 46838]SFF31749.1 PAS domain S-box-containing protein/diguanylate cyclase (GGDEF) domain-containing protein [Blastococcus sp. DSM 46838]
MGERAPRGPSRPARTRGWFVVVLAALAGHLLLAGTGASDGIYFLVVVGAAAASWFLVGTGAGRTSGVLLALGLTANAGADLVWQVLVWRGVDVDVSAAEVLYLTSYVLVAAALTRMADATGRPARARVDGWIDAVIVFVAVLLLMGELTLADTLADASQPWVVRVTWALYPALDAALIALVFRLVAGSGRYDRRALAVAAGAVCWLASDVGYLLTADPEAPPVLLESGWMLGAVLLAVASRRRPDRPVPRDRPESGGLARLAVCLGALLVPATIELVHDLTDGAESPLSMFGATLVLVLLVFLRTARLLQAESAARALVRSQARYSAALAAHSSDAVIVVDRLGRLQSDPAPLAALLGADLAADLAVSALLAGAGLDAVEGRMAFRRALDAGGAVVSAELPRRTADGERWLGVRLVDLSDDPDVRGVVIHATDITERKRAEQTLAHQAFHDGLTGLANRALFTDRVEQALRHNARHGDTAAVVYIDLDGFKAVNDSLGHQAGDRLLQKVAERLAATVRGGDTLARLGGDEFAILVEQTTGAAEASAAGERVLAALEGPIRIGRQSVTVSGSIGIAVSDGEATSDSMIRDADNAMYAAKAAGRGRVVVFDPAMRAAAVEQRELERELQGALAGGQLRLVYQPVIDLADEAVVGFEALLRWRSPALGSIPPDRFVPLAEDLGLIGEIGSWVLREACTTAAAWRRQDPAADLTIAVNVSAVQLASPDLVGHLAEALRVSGLPASALVLEVTETALVRDPDAAADQLAALRALGVRLALDDFGTGYSSLSYLRQFTVDILKIDRSFISTIQGAALPPIVRGLIDLGRTLDLEIVAEGVELEVQRDQLRNARCDLAQGYLFAAPLEQADAGALLGRRPAPLR